MLKAAIFDLPDTGEHFADLSSGLHGATMPFTPTTLKGHLNTVTIGRTRGNQLERLLSSQRRACGPFTSRSNGSADQVTGSILPKCWLSVWQIHERTSPFIRGHRGTRNQCLVKMLPLGETGGGPCKETSLSGLCFSEDTTSQICPLTPKERGICSP